MHNKFVREAGEFAGRHAIRNYLPLHFQPGAVQRYRYSARRSEYNKIKQRMRRVRPWITGGKRGVAKPAPKPPAPWVWSGDLRDKLLSKSPEDFNIRSTATSKTQKVQIKLPTPHPISRDHRGELGRITNAEMKEMSKLAIQHYRDSIESLKGSETTVIRSRK